MLKPRTQIDFLKMSGAGNDFILIDNLDGRLTLAWSRVAAKLCDRRMGVGADGLLVLEPSDRAPFSMKYYNADGSYGGMCGNGGRCSARYVMDKTHSSEVRFESLGHVYFAALEKDNVKLKMKDVNSFKQTISLRLPQLSFEVFFVDTGAPHTIVPLDRVPQIKTLIQSQGVMEIGRQIRQHETFAPSGTNVDFVDVLPDNTLSMRTYERGVEGETLACGTGAVASSIYAAITREFASPVTVRTRGGEILKVSFIKTASSFEQIYLHGSAEVIYTGTIGYQAE